MNRLFSIAGFTLAQALLSTAVALAVGLPAAFFTARRQFPGRRFLLSLASVPFCIPSLLIALGYVTFFGRAGTLNQLLMWITGSNNPPVSFLYSFAGIIICHGFYNFPLIMSTVSHSWERINRSEQEAATLLGASSFKVFRTITIWQLLPSIVSACIPVFLYCFFSFMIVLMFGSIGTTTLEVEVYQLAKVNLNFAGALKTGLLETVVALAFVAVWTAAEQKASGLKGMSFRNESLPKHKIKAAELFPAILLFSFIILFFLCPLGGIAANALSSQRLKSAFTFYNFSHLAAAPSFWNAIKWTFITASLTGLFCALTAFLYAVLLKTYDGNGKRFIFRIIPVVPMAVSSVVTGLLLTLLVRRGNFLILIFAQTLLNWPIAFRQIYPDMQKLPQNTVDAAVILSKNPINIITKLYFPVCRKGFLRSAGFCFAISAGDATLPLVLAIPRFDTLALYVYRLAGRYRFNEACAAGFILGIICLTVFCLSDRKTSFIKRK